MPTTVPLRENQWSSRLPSDRICTISGCGRPHAGKGFCATHRWRQKNGRDLYQPFRGSLRDQACSFPQCDRSSTYNGTCQSHHNVLKRYGLTLPQYLTIWNSQDGLCGICLSGDRELVVDHDHSCCPTVPTCGRCTRGLLCRSCNTRIAIYDNNDFTTSADAYRFRYWATHGNPDNWKK